MKNDVNETVNTSKEEAENLSTKDNVSENSTNQEQKEEVLSPKDDCDKTPEGHSWPWSWF